MAVNNRKLQNSYERKYKKLINEITLEYSVENSFLSLALQLEGSFSPTVGRTTWVFQLRWRDGVSYSGTSSITPAVTLKF